MNKCIIWVETVRQKRLPRKLKKEINKMWKKKNLIG